jgi:hypothetical protein
MNSVMISRRVGALQGFLSRRAMADLVKTLNSTKDYESLPEMYKRWLADENNVPTNYLSESAKKVRAGK